MRAEAADGNGTNNANFSTPAADGGAPRMQMYLWPGNQLGAAEPLVIGGDHLRRVVGALRAAGAATRAWPAGR